MNIKELIKHIDSFWSHDIIELSPRVSKQNDMTMFYSIIRGCCYSVNFLSKLK